MRSLSEDFSKISNTVNNYPLFRFRYSEVTLYKNTLPNKKIKKKALQDQNTLKINLLFSIIYIIFPYFKKIIVPVFKIRLKYASRLSYKYQKTHFLPELVHNGTPFFGGFLPANLKSIRSV